MSYAAPDAETAYIFNSFSFLEFIPLFDEPNLVSP